MSVRSKLHVQKIINVRTLTDLTGVNVSKVMNLKLNIITVLT